MKKAAVILAPGFEEGEALNVIDILRRAGVDCESVSLSGKQVTGSHKITVCVTGSWPRMSAGMT